MKASTLEIARNVLDRGGSLWDLWNHLSELMLTEGLDGDEDRLMMLITEWTQREKNEGMPETRYVRLYLREIIAP